MCTDYFALEKRTHGKAEATGFYQIRHRCRRHGVRSKTWDIHTDQANVRHHAFSFSWFAGSAAADFVGNGAGAPAVQSIFDFLGAWFVGC